MREDGYFDSAIWVFFDAVSGERYTGSTGLYGADPPEIFTHSTAWPQIWAPVDRLTKAALSAIYLDLGLSSSVRQPSMVSDADTLRYWSANLSTIVKQSSVDISVEKEAMYVNVTDYDTQQAVFVGYPAQLGALPDSHENSLGRAVIDTLYVCQRPQLKSPFNIFVSILVADLVFLRTAWSLYNLVVGYFLKSRHPDANICVECLARKEEDNEQVDGNVETAQVGTDTSHTDKVHEVDEHIIELDYLGPPSPDIRRDDQGSTQSLLTHRHV
ncbi:hypothetical protein KCU95_g10031, partial [Aureobasidium melanogenum]